MLSNCYIVIGYDHEGQPSTGLHPFQNWESAMKFAHELADSPANPKVAKAHVFYGQEKEKESPKVVDNRPVRSFSRKAH